MPDYWFDCVEGDVIECNARRVHMTIDLNWIIKTAMENPRKLIGLVMNDDGTLVSPIKLYNLAIDAKAKGCKVLPMCDNADEEGYCQGHEIVKADNPI